MVVVLFSCWCHQHKSFSICISKCLVEAMNRYEKKEKVRKSRFFLENDSEKMLEQSQSAVERD